MNSSNPLQWTLKTSVYLLFFTGIAIYSIYNYYPRKIHKHIHHMMTWKNGEFINIPSIERSIFEVTEKSLVYELDGNKIHLVYREIIPTKKENVELLFLHGQAFSSKVWSEIGTMQIMGNRGFRCIAIDLPGGSNSQTKVSLSKEVDPIKFIEGVIDRLEINRPIIISPSMSGKFSIPYIMNDPVTCQSRISGFIPIAPTSTHLFKDFEYHRCQIPVMILYGSKDMKGLDSVGDLRNMPNNEIITMVGAGHACYLNIPDEFNKYVYNFALAVDAEERSQ